MSLGNRTTGHNGFVGNRRSVLRAGGLSLLGLSTPLLRSWQAATATETGRSPRPHSCVFLFLFGGPSHIDLWDMKPDAPAEIRGEFRPIATSVPGIQRLRAPAAAGRGRWTRSACSAR